MGLIAAETNGRSQHTEALYREHGAAVAALCRSLLRDRSEAEDATQQVFLSAHRALLNGATPREPLAWLLVVARNECYARFRQRAVAPVPTGEAPDRAAADASVHAQRAGELASVWDEVGRMPAAQREAFLLREIRGLSYGQLADELSLSPPSVRSLLLRARARLRQRLRDVAALGGTPWLQGLFRLAGGEGTSPVPAATKAAVVGLGALALVGGGDVPRPAFHASPAPTHATSRHRAATRARHVVAPIVVPHDAKRDAEPEHPTVRKDGSGSDRSSGRDGSGSGSSSESGRGGGSDDTTATAPVTQPTTDGHDGGSSGSDRGSGSTTTTTQTTETSTTTTTSSGPDGGSDGSGSGGSGGSGSDGGVTTGGSDGGGTSGGGTSGPGG